ncbi:predicted protein [Botrytis cinerea T4]|uniref:Uncharacterized protein n=1 Tax=Botryotinia fuckeliana (strain T4) TaxID=999810 RepID=G2XR66_BOTF4|nr:predicted protein [Botrytis cinerea T4]
MNRMPRINVSKPDDSRLYNSVSMIQLILKINGSSFGPTLIKGSSQGYPAHTLGYWHRDMIKITTVPENCIIPTINTNQCLIDIRVSRVQ